jgi:GT2 family glycosyltransferase
VPIFDDLILNGSAIPNSSVVVRTDLLTKVNGLSEDVNLVAAEDYDCWLRISLVTNRFAPIPGVLGFYWQGLTNNSNPEKKSINLKRLQELYFYPFIKKHSIEMPAWFLYECLRSSYLLGDFKEASAYIKLMNKRTLTLSLKLKLLFIQMRIKLS